MAEHEHTQTAAAEADSKWAAIVARLDDVSSESREAAGEAVMDAYLLGLERGAARAAAASGSWCRAQVPAVEGAVSVIDPAVTVPVVRPVDLHFGLRRDDRVRLADLDMRDRHGQAVRHASPNCACGVNDAGQRYVDSICRTGDN